MKRILKESNDAPSTDTVSLSALKARFERFIADHVSKSQYAAACEGNDDVFYDSDRMVGLFTDKMTPAEYEACADKLEDWFFDYAENNV
jgi:hypothetical protein